MATLGNSFIDLIDIYKMQDGRGQFNPVIEMLMEMNPILEDAIAVECNKGSTHLHTVRTGLPSVTWGRLYQGIPNSKGRTAQVEDTTGFVEGLSTIDKRLLDLSTNEGAVRLSEAQAYLESMSQEVASKIFYGDTASDPEEFMGLAPRFNDLSASNGNQIIDAGGTGSDNTSIWFVTWGDNQCNLLYPKGTQAGVQREDMGEQRVTDSNGNAYYAKEEKFTWHVGMAVKDWRYVSRIANIDVSNMQGGSVALYDFMRKAYYQLQNRRVAGGKIAIYCNRDVLEALDALAVNQGASDNFVRLKPMEIEGKEVMTYRGIPIRETDALLNSEARVV
ncbi:major capsid protein [Vibrio phage MZH0603]|nr:major capsid protein [Vibrio phage MZH0603]